jgi:hypothetical protein
MSTPASRKVRLVFTESFVVTESAANVGAFRYLRLNSAYDVDTTLGSTSTPGYIEWTNFFSNYRVWSTAVAVEASASGGSAGSQALVSLVPNALQATLPSTAAIWPVQPGALHWNILMYSSGGANKVMFKKRYSLPKIFKITRPQFLSDFDFSATTGSNPARQAFLAVCVQGVGSSSAVSLLTQVYVSMEIEFFNPIQLST